LGLYGALRRKKIAATASRPVLGRRWRYFSFVAATQLLLPIPDDVGELRQEKVL